jgi:hypothetical protein
MGNPTKSPEDEWEVIVPPLPQEEAEKRFEQWKRDQQGKRLTLRPEDVRMDRIHQGPQQGCVVRFLIRKRSV